MEQDDDLFGGLITNAGSHFGIEDVEIVVRTAPTAGSLERFHMPLSRPASQVARLRRAPYSPSAPRLSLTRAP